MNKNNIGIQNFLTKNIVIIASVMFGLLLLIWVVNEYHVFSSENKLLKEEYEDAQKKMLKNEVKDVVKYIDYMKDQTEIRLKSELNNRVNEAIDIARNIYQENIDSKPLSEIKKMVKDALRPIRFFEGKGYYFAFSMDGIETLFADRPEMEGKNMLPVQGDKGEFVVRDMIDLVKKQSEGFYQYTWTKPSHKEKGFLKIAYVKYFKPFDWVFGTGEYLDDFTNRIQNMVLERIVNLRFSDEGYFFGSTEGGYPLFTNRVITKGANRIWEMTDPNGVKIIQEQQSVSKQPDGGFVRYSWPKLGSSTPVPKISYVREIPGWGWTIGAGVYLDTVEKTIAKSKDTLKRQLIKESITSICVLIGFIGVIWFWAKRVADKTHKTIEIFEKSFKNAATTFVTIPADDMQFSELSRIAKSANKMIAVQKKTEKSLRESEKMYRALVKGIPDTVMRFDREGRHLFVSDNVRKTVDMEPERFIGKTHAELGFPENQCRFWEESIRRVFDSNVPFETEFTFEGKAGPFIFDWRLIPERDAQGAISSVLSISRDTTAHRKAEQDYQTLFREMLDGFALHEIILDADGIPVDYRFLAINPAFERMTGLKAANIIGRTVLEVLPGTEHHWIETYGKVALTGEPLHFENYSAELTKHFDVTTFRPVEGQFACIFQDITERKKVEAERKRLQAQLTQAQKMESVGSLAGGVAHDFNNMLSIILANVELLQIKIDKDSPLLSRIYEIKKAAQRSADLTRQLLAFARKQTISPKTLNLNHSIEGVLEMLKRLIGEDIELLWFPKKHLWSVKMDTSQIDQILTNLCINARDAIQDIGKITIETDNICFDDNYCREHRGVTLGEFVLIAVSDNGCGMDKETIDKVFEPFFTTKKKGKGTGLGMATVYGIIKQNNGFINVYSEPGQGTTFKLYVPRHEKCQDEESVVEKEKLLKGFETVLLVEDEKSLLEVTKTTLEQLGYTVLTANTPKEAIRIGNSFNKKIDLMITDVVMPLMNGRELAEKMLQSLPNIKILYMSGYTANVIAHKGILDEGFNFINKPFSSQEISVKLRKILDENS